MPLLSFRLPVYLCLFTLLATPLAAAELVPVELHGIQGSLAANVRSQLSVDRMGQSQRGQVSPARLDYLQRITPDEIRAGLEPFGYYDVGVTMAREVRGESIVLVADIVLGEPVKVRKLELRVDGPAGEDEAIQAQLRAFYPQPGQVFDHGAYEAGKARIARRLGERGYFDADLAVHTVTVSRAEAAADVALAWTGGNRYRLGAVRFEGQPLKDGVLDPLVPWKPGELYDQARLLALQQSLVDADYFSAISLTPEPDKAVDGQVPVLVSLVPAKRSLYNLGLRYGSDAGAGLDARVERRYLNRSGHKVLVDLRLAQFDKDLVAQYRVPAFGWLDGWYALSLELRQEQVEDLTSEFANLAVTRSGHWRGWELLAGLNFKRERYDVLPGDRLDYITLIYPSVWGKWKHGDEVNSPRHGRSLELELRGGGPGSDVRFVQLRAEAHWIRSVGANNRVLLRGELGTTFSGNIEDFPPSMRFYAGGDRSIRGFGYKEIGPNRNGRVFGGQHLAVASIEFEHMFTPVWGAAVFVDGGDAFDKRFNAHVGIGAGLRWRSPVGPVRVDLAHGVDDADQSLRLHISLGPDL